MQWCREGKALMGIFILLTSAVLIFYSIFGAMERRIPSSKNETCTLLPYLPSSVQLYRCNDTLQVRQYCDVKSYYSIDLSLYDVISICDNVCK